jgi:hypothetical protein
MMRPVALKNVPPIEPIRDQAAQEISDKGGFDGRPGPAFDKADQGRVMKQSRGKANPGKPAELPREPSGGGGMAWFIHRFGLAGPAAEVKARGSQPRQTRLGRRGFRPGSHSRKPVGSKGRLACCAARVAPGPATIFGIPAKAGSSAPLSVFKRRAGSRAFAPSRSSLVNACPRGPTSRQS